MVVETNLTGAHEGKIPGRENSTRGKPCAVKGMLLNSCPSLIHFLHKTRDLITRSARSREVKKVYLSLPLYPWDINFLSSPFDIKNICSAELLDSFLLNSSSDGVFFTLTNRMFSTYREKKNSARSVATTD